MMAIAAVVAGCGQGSQAPSPSSPASTAEAAVMPTPTQTDVNGNGVPDSDPSDDDWPGKMTVVYEDATTPDAIRGRKFMEDSKLLPQLADDITTSLKLPYDIPLKGSQCDEPNDFWSPGDQEMTLCYEDVANSLDLYAQLGDEDPEASAWNEALASFYHETGHMVIDLYDPRPQGAKRTSPTRRRPTCFCGPTTTASSTRPTCRPSWIRPGGSAR